MGTSTKFVTLSGAQRLAENVLVKIEDSKYVHPTESGSRHVPSGGVSGQILIWASDGEATWEDDPLIIEVNDNKSSVDLALDGVGDLLDAHNASIEEALQAITGIEGQVASLESSSSALDSELDATAATAEAALALAQEAKSIADELSASQKEDDNAFQVEDGKLQVGGAVVEQDMQVGSWIWVSRSNGNMSLKWVGGDA